MAVEALLPNTHDLSEFALGKYYEVRGSCRSGKELEVRGWTSFGSDFGSSVLTQT